MSEDSNIVKARKELVEEGILEDSGERRPDSKGVMQVVWRLSEKGRQMKDYDG